MSAVMRQQLGESTPPTTEVQRVLEEPVFELVTEMTRNSVTLVGVRLADPANGGVTEARPAALPVS